MEKQENNKQPGIGNTVQIVKKRREKERKKYEAKKT